MRTDDEEKLQAARAEFELQKNLTHPHIVEVKDLIFDQVRSTMYTVMELCEGKQIQELVLQKGPYPGKIFQPPIFSDIICL